MMNWEGVERRVSGLSEGTMRVYPEITGLSR
jgi:hypothetical protein